MKLLLEKILLTGPASSHTMVFLGKSFFYLWFLQHMLNLVVKSAFDFHLGKAEGRPAWDQQENRVWACRSSEKPGWNVVPPGGILVMKNSVLKHRAFCLCITEISPLKRRDGWVEHAEKTMCAGLWTFEGFGSQNNLNSKSSATPARPCPHLTWKGRGCQQHDLCFLKGKDELGEQCCLQYLAH